MQQMPIEQYREYLREDPKSMMMGYLPERIRTPDPAKSLTANRTDLDAQRGLSRPT